MHIDTILLNNSLLNLLVRFIINLVVLFVLVFIIYYRFSKKEEFVFSNMLLGIMIFLISSILGSVDLQIGLALGLFAIFAIIRFRTVQYSVKDITYVFMIIGISIINSQANIPPPILGAATINISILIITYLLELFLQRRSYTKLNVIYRKSELLKPGNKNDLLKDLSIQTGQNIEKVIIKEVDFKRSKAEIEVYFKE